MGRTRLGKPGGLEHRQPSSGAMRCGREPVRSVLHDRPRTRSHPDPRGPRGLSGKRIPGRPVDYMRYYEESFAEAIAPMDASAYKFLKLAFRKGNPAGEGKPAITATARRNHGMLGG